MQALIQGLTIAGVVLPLTREWIEMSSRQSVRPMHRVLPLTREWIEIWDNVRFIGGVDVLPLTREWIEISSSFRLKSDK